MTGRTYAENDPTNPAHYRHGDKERVDLEREALPTECFVAACISHAAKYLHRLGRKDAEEQELRKAAWYLQMAAHVLEPGLVCDPRDGDCAAWIVGGVLDHHGPSWLDHPYYEGLLP